MGMKDEIRVPVSLPSELEKELLDMRAESIELVNRDLFDDAVEMIRSAWHKVPEPKFNTSCSVKILNTLAEVFTIAGRPQELEPILVAWANDIETCGYKIVETAPFRLLGETYLHLGAIDKSKEQLHKAIKYGATEKDFVWMPKLYFDIARKKVSIDKVIQSLFREVRDSEEPVLPEAIRDQVNEAAEAGNKLMDDEEFAAAIDVWKKGLALIPEPRNTFVKSLWFEGSIGNGYFMQHDFENALRHFENAKRNVFDNAYENEFIMMRIGQVHFETGDYERAKKYLLRAYILAGEEIFNDEDPKYLTFLRTTVNLDKFEEE